MNAESTNELHARKKAILGCQKVGYALMSFANVIGTGAGFRQKGGKILAEHAIKVFVSQKLPEKLLHPTQILPRCIYLNDGTTVSVDVNEMAMPSVPLPNLAPANLSLVGPSAPSGSQFRPAPGGVSSASFRFPIGTLSTMVYDMWNSGGVCILSNNHVFAFLNQGKLGDPILQPSSYFGGQYPRDQIGYLLRFVPLNLGLNTVGNRVDAAVASVVSGSASPTVQFLGPLLGVCPIEEITPGTTVRKVGCSSGLTQGQVVATHVSVWINYALAGYGNSPALFVNQILTNHMAMYGDSGSLLLDSKSRAAGLLCAGSTTHTVFNYAVNVQHDLGVSFPGNNEKASLVSVG